MERDGVFILVSAEHLDGVSRGFQLVLCAGVGEVQGRWDCLSVTVKNKILGLWMHARCHGGIQKTGRPASARSPHPTYTSPDKPRTTPSAPLGRLPLLIESEAKA